MSAPCNPGRFAQDAIGRRPASAGADPDKKAILEVDLDMLEEDLGQFAVMTRCGFDDRDRAAERGYKIPADLANSLGQVRLISPRAEEHSRG